jgi:hypothetical protein
MMLSTEMATFTERARAWLSLTPSGSGSPRVIEWPGGRLVIADFVNCPDGYRLNEALLVRGRFICGRDCNFAGPVFVAGNVEAGKGSQFDCIATDGSLVAASGVSVRRWVYAKQLLDLRAAAAVGAEAISGGAIRLGIGASAALIQAPEITTAGFVSGITDSLDAKELLDLPPVAGFWQGRLSPLGSGTWVCEGDLHAPVPMRLRAKLVVRGSFSCPAGSIIDDDIKTGGSLHIGSMSVCRGHLTSLQNLTLDEGVFFSGNLLASGTLRISQGARGFRLNEPVMASGSELIVEPNACIRGQVKASNRVTAENAVESEDLKFLFA